MPPMTTKNFYLGLKQVLRLYKGSSLAWSYDGSEPEVPKPSTGNTTAILGKAILGKAILGNTVSLQKLATPSIYIGSTVGKLGTPTIYLHTGDDSGEEPDIPTKLDAPVIRIESVSGGEEEPDTPTIPKLTTPAIRLEVVSDADGEEEHTHEYVVLDRVDPTCTSSGYDRQVCAECGEDGPLYTIPALGHDWGEPYYSDEFSNGYGHKCNRCGETEEADPPMQKLSAPVIRLEVIEDEVHTHDYFMFDSAEPTCTEDGYEEYSCDECGDTYREEFPALGHTFDEPYYSDEFSTGYGRRCSRCGELEELDRPIVKLDTPVIRIEDVEEEVVSKLDTPTIEVVRTLPPTTLSLNGEQLSWTPVSGAGHYHIVIRQQNGNYGTTVATQGLSYSLSSIWNMSPNLLTGVPYEIYVVAYYSDIYDTVLGEPGEPSNVIVCTYGQMEKLATPEIYAETVADPIPVPAAPTASIINEDGVDYIVWNAVEGAQLYRVRYSLILGSSVGYAWIFPDKSELKYKPSVVYKGYDYEVYVQAHNGLIADESVTEYAKRYDEAGYGEPSNTLIYTAPNAAQ